MNFKLSVNHLVKWRQYSYWAWIETILLTGLGLLVCFMLNPQNPLFFKEFFPWPWLIPVIIVLQYGLVPSLLSVAIIVYETVMLKNSGLVIATEVPHYLLSGITLVMICVLFSSSWMRRVLHAESLYAYTEDRLKSLSRSYYMLRISSDYLEQNIIIKPVTLRMVLAELQKLHINEQKDLSKEIAYDFLQIIAQYCSLNALGIYLYSNNTLQTQVFVEIGDMGDLIVDNSLIKQSMKTQDIHYAVINHIEEAAELPYLIAMPLVSITNKLFGILVIKEMPFWSLNEETLRALSILVTYFMKEILVEDELEYFLNKYKDCSVNFARQIARLIYLKQNNSVDTAFVGILVAKEYRSLNVISHLASQHRLLDSMWVTEIEGYDLLINLMPFTQASGISGYFNRIQIYLQTNLSLKLDQDKIKFRSMQLEPTTPIEFIEKFLKYIKVE